MSDVQIETFEDRKPDSINEMGTKFWIEKQCNKYAESKGLKDIVVYYVETKESETAYLIVQDGKVVKDVPTLEIVGYNLDALSYLNKVNLNSENNLVR